MFDIFGSVDTFFSSLQQNNLNYNIFFIVFVSIFLVTVIGTIIAVAHSYEAKLTKAVDMFNNYLMENPSINEENLVAFNKKMKLNKVPKQLRKQWQQYVLYREGKASEYMSFENCVSNPTKNSSYKRSVKIFNLLSYICIFSSLILNFYVALEGAPYWTFWQQTLLTPILILVLNLIINIFLNLRYNAIVSDLFQNYQYFEVNIDKATKTLPEYVDYEVLFDKNEIKRGIPILYAYLQKRAEEEQRELELARLKNVEHEKFNFDESGVAGSLVLERAMQEAENYIAERKKYNQDTEQINADITQEDMNFREITKEYNRQMQVSKETFANFKSQLEDVSSSIEANYIKKQQQQELDRQRNLERDFDTASERHKKIIESYHAELDTVDKFRAQSRKVLEDAMRSEFETYSSKVYDAAKKAVEEREKEKYAKIKKQIKDLEEKIVLKNQELENAYNHNQQLSEKLVSLNAEIPVAPFTYVPKQEEPEEDSDDSQGTTFDSDGVEYKFNYLDNNEDNTIEEDYEEEELDNANNNYESSNYNEYTEDNYDEETEDNYNEYSDEEESVAEDEYEENKENISTEENESEQLGVTKRKAGRPRKIVVETDAEPKRGRGRPKKEKTEEIDTTPKKGRGRPKKVVEENSETVSEPKKGRGRPRKEVSQQETVSKQSKGRGRPRKEVVEDVETVSEPKKGRGRPKKVSDNSIEPLENTEKRGRGRPKKMEIDDDKLTNIEDIDAYLKEIDDVIAEENAKFEASKKELEKKAKNIKKKK